MNWLVALCLLVSLDRISGGNGHAYPYTYPITQPQHQVSRNQFGVPLGSFAPQNVLLEGQSAPGSVSELSPSPSPSPQPLPQHLPPFSATGRSVIDPFHGVKVTYLRSEATLAPPRPTESGGGGRTGRVLNFGQAAQIRQGGFVENRPISNDGRQISTPYSQHATLQPANFVFAQNAPRFHQNIPNVGIRSGISETPLNQHTHQSIVHQSSRITDQQLDQILNQDHITDSFIDKSQPNPIPIQQAHQNSHITNAQFYQNQPVYKPQVRVQNQLISQNAPKVSSPNLSHAPFSSNQQKGHNAPLLQSAQINTAPFNPNQQTSHVAPIVQSPQNHQFNPQQQLSDNAPDVQSTRISNTPFHQNPQISNVAPVVQSTQINNAPFNPQQQISHIAPVAQNPSNIPFNPNQPIGQNFPFYQNQQINPNGPFYSNQQITPNTPFSQNPQIVQNIPSQQHHNPQIAPNNPPFNPNPQINHNVPFNPNQHINPGSPFNPNQQVNPIGPFGPNPQQNYPFNTNQQVPFSQNPYLQPQQPLQSPQNAPFPGAPPFEPENGFNPNHLQSFPEPPYESEFRGVGPLEPQDAVELQAYVSKLGGGPERNAAGPQDLLAANGLSSRIVTSAIRNPGQLEVRPEELIQIAEGRPVPRQCAYNTITQGLEGEDCLGIRKR